jgi:hypothetical protein
MEFLFHAHYCYIKFVHSFLIIPFITTRILFLIKDFVIYSSIILFTCHLKQLYDSLKANTGANRVEISFKKLAFAVYKSIIISSFTRLVVIPLVIWNPNEIFFNLALIFTYLSNAQALSGRN